MKNSRTSTKRLVRAGHRTDVSLGLKPEAESYCPFGAETEFFVQPLKVTQLMALRPWAVTRLYSFNVLSIHSAVCEKTF